MSYIKKIQLLSLMCITPALKGINEEQMSMIKQLATASNSLGTSITILNKLHGEGVFGAKKYIQKNDPNGVYKALWLEQATIPDIFEILEPLISSAKEE